MHSTRIFILDCLWVCRKIRPSVGTSDHHRNFRGGSSQGLYQSSEEQIHVSTLCQNFRPLSEVPVQCSQRLRWMFRSTCMFRRTVGSSGVDPRRGSVSVPTHNYMFRRTVGSSEPVSLNLNSVSLSENIGRSDALSEDPTGSQKTSQRLVFGGWVFIPPHPLHCVLLT